MAKEKYNPFDNFQDEDLEITSKKQLEQAKKKAGVVNSQEHLERLITSGDEKLVQAGLEQFKKQLQEKDETIDNLKQQISLLENDKTELDKIREKLQINENKDEMIIRSKGEERHIWSKGIEENIKDMSKEEFENQYGSEIKNIGWDPRHVLDAIKKPSNIPSLDDPSIYLEKISTFLKDEGKEVVVVEGRTYIVDKK